MKTRYAVTHVSRETGLRTLTFANQGRFHYDAPEAAQAWIDAARKDPRTMEIMFGGLYPVPDTFEVRAVECYDSGDAVGIYFSGEKGRVK